jgi:hypothetical protein
MGSIDHPSRSITALSCSMSSPVYNPAVVHPLTYTHQPVIDDKTITLGDGPHIDAANVANTRSTTPLHRQSQLSPSASFYRAVEAFNHGQMTRDVLLTQVASIIEQCTSWRPVEPWLAKLAEARNPRSGETGHADRSVLNAYIGLCAESLRRPTGVPWEEKRATLNQARQVFEQMERGEHRPDYETYGWAILVCHSADHPGENAPQSWGMDLACAMHDQQLLPRTAHHKVGTAMLWAFNACVEDDDLKPDLRVDIAAAAVDVYNRFPLEDSDLSTPKAALHSNALRLFSRMASDATIPESERTCYETKVMDVLDQVHGIGVKSRQGWVQMSLMADHLNVERTTSHIRSYGAALTCDLFNYVRRTASGEGKDVAVAGLLTACRTGACEERLDALQRLIYVEAALGHADPSTLGQNELHQLITVCRAGATPGEVAFKQRCATAAMNSMGRLQIGMRAERHADALHAALEACVAYVDHEQTPVNDKTAFVDRVWTYFSDFRRSNLPLATQHRAELDCTSYALLFRVCAQGWPRGPELLQNAVSDKVFRPDRGLDQFSNKLDLRPGVVFEPTAGPLDHMPASVGETIWRFWERKGKIDRWTRIELGSGASTELTQRIEACQAGRGWPLYGPSAGR